MLIKHVKVMPGTANGTSGSQYSESSTESVKTHQLIYHGKNCYCMMHARPRQVLLTLSSLLIPPNNNHKYTSEISDIFCIFLGIIL